MISWKNPFDKLNEEYELTQKKKEALDRLHDDGKISQSTYDSFNKKIDEAISEIERQQKVLLEKMNAKAQELEEHIKTLETLLANFEIRHVTGEVEEEVYQREVDLLSIGLETAKEELDGVKEAVDQLSRGIPIQSTDTDAPEVDAPEEAETQSGENIQSETGEEETPQVVEIETTSNEIEEPTLPEPPRDTVEDDTGENIYQPQESQENPEVESQDTEEETETWQDAEENEETTETLEEEVQREEDEETQGMW